MSMCNLLYSFAVRLLVIALFAVSAQAFAQDYPVKPVRVVVPYSPGGGTDVLSRAIGERLSAALGQSFVVENRPGANGAIGSEVVAKSAPDGYTLVVVTGTHVINPFLQKVPFDTLKDFTPVTFAAISKMVVVAGLQQPFASIKELITYAKANPGMTIWSRR